MQNLQHSLMTITPLLDEFFLSYGYSASDKEKAVYVEWAKYLTEEELRFTLNTDNHYKSSTGQRIRPNLGTLKDIVSDMRTDRYDRRRMEDTSLLDDEECWYCTEGFVIDVFEDQGNWFKRCIGRCTCAKGDNTGYLAKKRPAEPSKRLQDYAREHSLSCAVAADVMTVEKNRDPEVLYEPDLDSVKIPF